MTSVYVDVDQNKTVNQSSMNITCISLKSCHDRGRCIILDNQLKCL
jgi:hypothetical protein